MKRIVTSLLIVMYCCTVGLADATSTWTDSFGNVYWNYSGTPEPITDGTPVATPVPVVTNSDVFFYDAPIDYTYIENDTGGITITKYIGADGKALVIPDMINGKPVTEIGDYAFESSTITAVTFPSSVKRIGRNAFFNSRALIKAILPEGIEEIKYGAFSFCSQLQELNIPASVRSIGSIIEACPCLNNLTVSEESTWLSLQDGLLFANQKVILGVAGEPKELNIPQNAESILSGVFRNQPNLMNISIPEGIREVGTWAFRYCNNLTSVELPASIETIGELAFADCPNLITISGRNDVAKNLANDLGIQYIDLDASEHATVAAPVPLLDVPAYLELENGLKLTLENNEWIIADYTGNEQTLLIPSDVMGLSIARIDSHAFQSCKSLQEVEISAGITLIGEKAFLDCTNLRSVALPDGLLSIGESAFERCETLQAISIPNTVSSIGRSAFNSCSALRSVTLPAALTAIEEQTFSSCKRLQSVIVPDGVTFIGYHAFAYCISLTSVELPDSVAMIMGSCFEGTMQDLVFRVIEGTYADHYCQTYGYRSAVTASSKQKKTEELFPVSKTENGLVLTLDSNNEWTVIDYIGTQSHVKIPSEFLGKRITSISSHAFIYKNNIYSVEMPDSIVSIGDWAFSSCTGLHFVTFSQETVSIGEWAFSWCYNLQTVEVPNNVTFIGDSAFVSCYNLRSVTLSPNLSSIGYGTFEYCSSLQTIVIPDGIQTIENSCFYSCQSLESAVLAQSVEKIGTTAFDNCPKLTTISGHNDIAKTLAEWLGVEYIDLTVVEDAAVATSTPSSIPSRVELENGLKLTKTSESTWRVSGYTGDEQNLVILSQVMGYPVAEISDYAFSRCTSLKTITIPDGVVSIGNSAFSGCTNLESINLPESIISLADWAFDDCEKLKSIVLPSNLLTIGYAAFSNCSSLQSIELPEGIESIENSTFSHCSNLKTVQIPQGVLSIGDWAFYNCSSLQSLVLPNGILSIGDNAFLRCSKMESIYLPDGLISIGAHAFSQCELLHAIAIPDSVASIGDYAFESCFALAEAKIPKSITAIGKSVFSLCLRLQEIVIPDSVTFIDYSAFTQCRNLASVEIPSSVQTIGKDCFAGTPKDLVFTVEEYSYAYYYCTNYGYNYKVLPTKSKPVSNSLPLVATTDRGIVVSLTADNEWCVTDYLGKESALQVPSEFLGYKVTEIGSYAFFFCQNLKSIVLPNSISSIAESAFASCSMLHSINIPEGVASIGNAAFSYCTSLEQMVLPDTITLIGESAFSGCTKLQSVVISENISTISTELFRNCSSLETICIPQGVVSINQSAFQGCKALRSIQLPNGMSIIDRYAFNGCSVLAEVMLPASITSIGSDVFKDCSKNVKFIVEKDTYAENFCKENSLSYVYEGGISGWNGTSYPYILFGVYPQENDEKQSILWRILNVQDQCALLLSEYVLDAQPFDSRSSDWKKSDIRIWLNQHFAQAAFDEMDMEALLPNDDNIVFLLSVNEYSQNEYGFSSRLDEKDPQRVAKGTPYAIQRGLWVASDQTCSYYTRTPIDSSLVNQVRADGALGNAKPTRDNVGIRPAIILDVEVLEIFSGNGTVDEPYVVEVNVCQE